MDSTVQGIMVQDNMDSTVQGNMVQDNMGIMVQGIMVQGNMDSTVQGIMVQDNMGIMVQGIIRITMGHGLVRDPGEDHLRCRWQFPSLYPFQLDQDNKDSYRLS
ncbi:hypothetical protein [Paenibacillus sp. NPDC057967]|uniref:hypothetical protein n=1 Tax=Paenibacillus sp. NPDC057967 TaxID=3346293 RepID=UPI0036DB6A7F